MYEPNLVRFGPRLDGDFFPDDPERLVSNPDTPKRPTIIGASDAEFLLFGLFF
jgi:hypothetical protein